MKYYRYAKCMGGKHPRPDLLMGECGRVASRKAESGAGRKLTRDV